MVIDLMKKKAIAILWPAVSSYRRKRVRRTRKKLPDKLRRQRSLHPEMYSDPEISRAIDYVLEHGTKIFPHPYTEKYNDDAIEVYTDGYSGLKYVMHSGHPLYMRRGSRESDIKGSYRLLSIEQDPLSPHCYQTGGFEMDEGSVLFDIGCAEGNFSLSNIERASRVFLFETDEKWLEPLARTFEKWKDKVVIINKFVSGEDGKRTVTVDTVMREYGISGPVFLKMDVEGAEPEVLRGARETLARSDVKAVICTYHRQGDHAELSGMMERAGYKVRTSSGYMLFVYDHKGLKPPYFRRGVIYCTKQA